MDEASRPRALVVPTSGVYLESLSRPAGAKKTSVDSEWLGSENRVQIDADGVLRWDPPWSTGDLPEDERERIRRSIAAQLEGYRVYWWSRTEEVAEGAARSAR